MNSIEQQFPNVRGQGDYLRRSLEEARSLRERDLTHTGESLERLTQRQREILLKVVDGAPNKAIAQDLNISQRTVEKHREVIRQKMGVRSLAELVRAIVLFEAFTRGGGLERLEISDYAARSQ